MPVTACGVVRYANRKRATRVSRFPPESLFSPAFTVCTARSAKPFVAGWYGALRMCFIAFLSMNSANSVLVKSSSLSDTSTCGRPWVANVWRSRSIVTVDVDDVITWASFHFECASTIFINNIYPSNDPMKSMWSRGLSPMEYSDTPTREPVLSVGGALMSLTCVARLCLHFEVLVDFRPPHKTSGDRFHAHDTGMRTM